MNSMKNLSENEISKIVVDSALKVHKQLGPGLLESVYQKILKMELEKRGLKVESEVPLPVEYDGELVDSGYRADLFVEKKVIIELKATQKPNIVHKQQLLSYLKLSNIKLGLLINFGLPLLKDGINRVVNGLEDN